MRTKDASAEIVSSYVLGWLLEADQRQLLLDHFAPKYYRTLAHHVTLAVDPHQPIVLPTARRGRVVGRVDDEVGLEALVVEIGMTTRRPDGGVYHITWSLDPVIGRQARETNEVLDQRGWFTFGEPLEIELLPAYWARSQC